MGNNPSDSKIPEETVGQMSKNELNTEKSYSSSSHSQFQIIYELN